MSKEYRVYFDDIIDSISKINKYIKSYSFEDFIGDEKTIDAVVRNICIIGEAASKIHREFQSSYPEIEWKEIIGMRHKLIHNYSGINYSIVWNVITNKLPVLEKQLKYILKNYSS